MLYSPKKGDSPIMAIIYGQHQKFRVVRESFRYKYICASNYQHIQLFSRLMHLSEPIVQWLRQPGEGLLYELIQLFTDMSCLAAAVDSADVDKSFDHQASQLLLHDCLLLERRHLKFYAKVSGNGEDPSTYMCGEIKTGVSATDELFGPGYRFRSVGEANLHMILWTSLSLLYPIICQAYAVTETRTDDMPEFLRIDDQSPQNVAHQLSTFNISKAIRCLPYCAQEGMNLWALLYCVFPAIQATRVFSQARDWERFLWALELFRYFGASGFDVAARYHALCSHYWFDPSKYGNSSSWRLPDPNGLTKGHYGST